MRILVSLTVTKAGMSWLLSRALSSDATASLSDSLPIVSGVGVGVGLPTSETGVGDRRTGGAQAGTVTRSIRQIDLCLCIAEPCIRFLPLGQAGPRVRFNTTARWRALLEPTHNT